MHVPAINTSLVYRIEFAVQTFGESVRKGDLNMPKIIPITGALSKGLASKDKNPLEILIERESQKTCDQELRADIIDEVALRVPDALRSTLRKLCYDDVGCFTALATDVWNYTVEQVAELFDKSESAIRLAKLRALGRHRCGEVRGVCARRPRCAHARGQLVWEEVIRQVVSPILGDEEPS